MTDIKVLDRDTPVSVSGRAQKETLRSECDLGQNVQTRWDAR